MLGTSLRRFARQWRQWSRFFSTWPFFRGGWEANLERNDLERALSHKGFVCEDSRKDHRFYRLVVDGKKSDVFTKVSRGKQYRTLGPPLVAKVAQQLHVSQGDLKALVECTLSGEAYLKLLQAALEKKGRTL